MAKTRSTRRKGLREPDGIPNVPEVIEDGWTERQNILDHALPTGAYLLDAIMSEMLREGRILIQTTEDRLVRDARGAADVSGHAAIKQAHNELSEKRRRGDAKLLLMRLHEMSAAARSLQRFKPDEVAPLIARDDDVDYPNDKLKRAIRSTQFAEGVVEQLLRNISAMNQDIESFIKRYEVVAGIGSSSEPLTNWYIFCCAQSWRSLTGSWARKNDCSDFRRFLVASWTDLGLPAPTDRDGLPKPLEDHFRDRLAKSDVFDKFRGN